MPSDIRVFVRWTVFGVFAVWWALVLVYNLYVARRWSDGRADSDPDAAPALGSLAGLLAAATWPGETGWVSIALIPGALLCELPFVVYWFKGDQVEPPANSKEHE
jgi:hypothetical protein